MYLHLLGKNSPCSYDLFSANMESLETKSLVGFTKAIEDITRMAKAKIIKIMNLICISGVLRFKIFIFLEGHSWRNI